MALPFFYSEEINTGSDQLLLNEETSRHVVQVLRMQEGEQLNLTDGKGNLVTVEIAEAHKKKCTVNIVSSSVKPTPAKRIKIAISLIKNTSRFEWFLEKATEIGVSEIIPLICNRTEKQHFRSERMHSILVSAMLQSMQCRLPQLHEPVKFEKFVAKQFDGQKFIAHCIDEQNKEPLTDKLINKSTNSLILIGPEGDFTKDEIAGAFSNQFLPVSLGDTRLRTETAGIVSVALLQNF